MKSILKFFSVIISLLIVFLVCFWITFLMIDDIISSDFPAHLDIWTFYHDRGKIPFPPLYYLTFFGISGFIPSSQSLKLGLLTLICLSWLAKYFLTYCYLNPELSNRTWVKWIPLGLMFFFPVSAWVGEGTYWFLGKMTPNLWHNGSTIFVFPFCMLLFFEVNKWLFDRKPRYFLISLYTLLILLIKPNFLFGLIPALLSFMVLSWVNKKSLIPILIYSIWVILFLFLSKWLIFSETAEDSLFYNFNARGDVMIDPFGVWLKLSENPLWDLFGSFPLLIASLIFFGKTLWANPEFRLAFLTFSFGILVFFLFAESGPGYLDGNFYWQIPISLFILYLVLAKNLLKMLGENSINEKSNQLKLSLTGFLFAIHVFSGLAYLIRIQVVGQFF